METADFFRARIDAMINLSDPLAVLATRLPWAQIEASVAAKFERQERAGQVLEGQDMFGPTLVLDGAGVSNAGRPKLPIRLMASLLYLKHSFNLSDEELVERWSENVLVAVLQRHGLLRAPAAVRRHADRALPARPGRGRHGAVAQGHHRHGRGHQGGQAQGVGARDRRHHGAGEGHRAPGGQPAAGDRAPQGRQRRQARRHRSSSRPLPRRARSCAAGPVATRTPSSSGA